MDKGKKRHADRVPEKQQNETQPSHVFVKSLWLMQTVLS